MKPDKRAARMEDGFDMMKWPIKQDDKAWGATLNAAGTGVLLQLDEIPSCHKCELHQIRVTLAKDEAVHLVHELTRLIGCLPADVHSLLIPLPFTKI